MSIETTMTEILSASGGGRVKTGDSTDTTFTEGAQSPPSVTSGSHAVNDRNRAPFDKPRASGGVPVKFFENVDASPGTLESTLENTGLIR